MRHRIARVLHRLNVHVFCVSFRRTMEWPLYRLDDGTYWKPDITGVPPTYTVHR